MEANSTRRTFCNRKKFYSKALKEKDLASMECVWSLWLFFAAMILLLFVYEMRLVRYEKEQVEDSIVAANLASAVIDLDQLKESGELRIADEHRAFEVYEKSLRNNLRLTTDFYKEGKSRISGQVSIEEYTIYNVCLDKIICFKRNKGGEVEKIILPKDGVYTPNGKLVENTTIYSKLQFSILGYRRQAQTVCVENCVDIVKTTERNLDEE